MPRLEGSLIVLEISKYKLFINYQHDHINHLIYIISYIQILLSIHDANLC
jgi:hypothetical protein